MEIIHIYIMDINYAIISRQYKIIIVSPSEQSIDHNRKVQRSSELAQSQMQDLSEVP